MIDNLQAWSIPELKTGILNTCILYVKANDKGNELTNTNSPGAASERQKASFARQEMIQLTRELIRRTSK